MATKLHFSAHKTTFARHFLALNIQSFLPQCTRRKKPHFSWDKDAINAKLVNVNKAAGFLAGRLSAIGFDAQMSAAVETLTHDILASSEIEGVVLNSDQVRSSVARRMGVHIVGDVEPSHYVEGVVEMMMD